LGGPGCTLYVCMCVWGGYGVQSSPVRSSQVQSGPVRSSQVQSGPVRSSQVKSGQVRSSQVGWAAATGFGAGRGRKKKHTQKQKQSKDENPDVHGARARADATVTPCACRLLSRFISSLSLFFLPLLPLVLHPELAFAVRSLDPCGYLFGSLAH
jgi:hypothetical protein